MGSFSGFVTAVWHKMYMLFAKQQQSIKQQYPRNIKSKYF